MLKVQRMSCDKKDVRRRASESGLMLVSTPSLFKFLKRIWNYECNGKPKYMEKFLVISFKRKDGMGGTGGSGVPC